MGSLVGFGWSVGKTQRDASPARIPLLSESFGGYLRIRGEALSGLRGVGASSLRARTLLYICGELDGVCREVKQQENHRLAVLVLVYSRKCVYLQPN